MKYFFDTEFHEYQKKPLFSKQIDTIELISIGIVAEDGRTYYAISKDFDLKAAWNKYQIENNHEIPQSLGDKKKYWLRDNILKPIWQDLKDRYLKDTENKYDKYVYSRLKASVFSMCSLGMLLSIYGKTNKEIASDIKFFTEILVEDKFGHVFHNIPEDIEFYAYYADYDWIVLCWLFGRMIDLPKLFPKYCKDLKQSLDETVLKIYPGETYYYKADLPDSFETKLEWLKNNKDYPKNKNEHNALSDALWNFELYKFISKWQDK